jgi:hypothetical protein
MSPRAMIVLIFTVIAVISPTVHGSLMITDSDYPLMCYTKLISEENFTAGRPLAIMLPIAEEETTKKQVGYLIEELNKSGRWPILVYNMDYKIYGIMYTEKHQHGSYTHISALYVMGISYYISFAAGAWIIFW